MKPYKILSNFFTISFFISFLIISEANSEIIFFDNFETHAINQYPAADWFNLYNGIKAEIAASFTYGNSPQSFRLEGAPTWSRIDGINLNFSNQITYQACVYVPDAQRGAMVGFFESQGNMAPSYNAVIFRNDGEICLHDNGQPDVELQSYNSSQWYIVTVAIDFSLNVMDVYIDGQKKHSGAPRSGRSHCHIFALETNNFNGSGTAIAYFDNVTVMDNFIPSGTKISTIGDIGAFAYDWWWSKDRHRDGYFAETRLDMPSSITDQSAITLSLWRWYSQVAGSAHCKVYLSTYQQVTPTDADHNLITWWVGNTANLGALVGEYDAIKTITLEEIDVTTFITANPADHYYVAIKNEGYADVAAYGIYLTAVETGPSTPQHHICEDFEPYDNGIHPDAGGWHPLFTGQNAMITSENACWGSKSFKLEGYSNWSRVEVIAVEYQNQVTFETAVYIPDKTKGARIGFFEAQGNQAPPFNAIDFWNDGKIYLVGTKQADRAIGSYQANTWHKIRVAIDFSQNILDVYVSDSLFYSCNAPAEKSHCTRFGFATNNFSGSGTSTIYVDNVIVIDRYLPPQTPKALCVGDWAGFHFQYLVLCAGFNTVSSLRMIPPELNPYSLVCIFDYDACNSTTASYLTQYVNHGGGVILVGGVPDILGMGNISSWFGASYYGNVYGAGLGNMINVDYPLGTKLTSGTMLFDPPDNLYVSGGATVRGLAADANVVAVWENGSQVSAFYHHYRDSRIYYSSGGSELRPGDPGYTTAGDTLLIYAMRWAGNNASTTPLFIVAVDSVWDNDPNTRSPDPWTNINFIVGAPDGNYAYTRHPAGGNGQPTAILDFGSIYSATGVKFWLDDPYTTQTNLHVFIASNKNGSWDYLGAPQGTGERILNFTPRNVRYVMLKHGQTFPGQEEGVDAIQLLIPTDVKESFGQNPVPQEYILYQNYPNPFNPRTTISYELPCESKVRLEMFDLNGRLVKTLVEDDQERGSYSIVWDACDHSGARVPGGLYLCQLRTDNVVLHKKLIFLK